MTATFVLKKILGLIILFPRFLCFFASSTLTLKLINQVCAVQNSYLLCFSAIGLVYQYDENGPTDVEILVMRQIVLLSFDAVVIVTKCHENATLNQRNTERAR